ncbi:MAG: Fur family ferric uptake transcriptional regulator [Candidatus Omnitrophota bacterium]|jgi:Fur family ferric uptake transcriptional regulator
MSTQRKTRQRSAIRNTIQVAGRPLSPQEVLELAQVEVPQLGQATVYRSLNSLVEEGVIRAVELPGERARYEPADLAHHHHFICTACKKVYDLEGCMLKHELKLPKGFTVVSHEITLSGTCPACK